MFKFIGKGIQWDKDKHCVLAKFKEGIFETSDKDVAKSLVEKGFKPEGAKKDIEMLLKGTGGE